MIQKPKHLGVQYAKVFKDASVVEAYRHRPPYPAEIFEILNGLITGKPGHVLDVGCGTGFIARHLVNYVERVDAVDFSHHMLETAKRLPNGDNPRLRWLYGAVEDIELTPSYALITAGESLHWMDWNIVLPRFHQLLSSGSYLALVGHETSPAPWYETLREIIPRYSTNTDFQAYNLVDMLQQHGLFQVVGQRTTAPVPFVQSVDDYIESFHSRNGFSKERMGVEQAKAFDKEAREILRKIYNDGVMNLHVVGQVVWGIPHGTS